MGKLTSYILGLSSALIISYIVLSQDYSPLINWLGPTMGSDIIFPFSLLYLLLGSLITYPVLLGSWVFLGIMVGIGARKGTRAIGAAISVYASIWGMLGLSALAVFEKFTGFSAGSTAVSQINTSFSIPPLPPGVTVSALLSEPLFQPLLNILSSFTGISSIFSASGAGAAASGSLLATFASVFETTFLPSLIANLAVFLLVSGLIGFAIHRLLNRNKSPGNPEDINVEIKHKIKKVKVRKVVRRTGKSGAILSGVISIALVAMMLANPSALNPQGHYLNASALNISTEGPHDGNQSLASQVIGQSSFILSQSRMQSASSSPSLNPTSLLLNYGGGYLGKYGNIYDVYAFINASLNSSSGMFSSFSTDNTILSSIFISANTESIFNALSQDGIINSSIIATLQSNHYYNLIPQSAIIEVSQGNISSNSASQFNEASGISSSIGGSAPVQFLGINLPSGTSSGTATGFSIFAYSINVTLSTAESSLIRNYGDSHFNGGSYPVFRNGVLNGTLVPGSTSNSVGASMFVAGELNPSRLPSSLGSYTSLLNNTNSSSGTVSFMGGLFLREHVVHSSLNTHNMSASQLFGYTGNISFGSNDTAYALSLMYPKASSPSASPDYVMDLFTNYRNLTAIGSAGTTNIYGVPSGSSLNLSNITFTTNATFPASMKVSQSVQHWTGNTYNVSIVLTNNDTDTLKNVSINAAPLLGIYGNGTALASGSTQASTGSLLPNHSLSVAFSIRLDGIGTYVVASPCFNYTMNGSSFNILGNTLTAYAQPPSVLHAVNQLEYVSFSTISSFIHVPMLVQPIYGGIYVFDLILLLIMILDLLIEMRAYRKWRTREKSQ